MCNQLVLSEKGTFFRVYEMKTFKPISIIVHITGYWFLSCLFVSCDNEHFVKPVNLQPVILAVSASPSAVIRSACSTLTVVAEDEDGDSLRYEWRREEGSFPSGTRGASASFVLKTA